MALKTKGPSGSSGISLISPEIGFRSKYQRNNKTGGQKHLRCFPQCYAGSHNRSGFCGDSVKVRYEFPKVEEDVNQEYIAIATFLLENSNNNSKDKVPSVIPRELTKEILLDNVNSVDKPLLPWYQAHVYHRDKNIICFEFNNSRRGWHYGWFSTKTTKDLYHYLGVEIFRRVPGTEKFEKIARDHYGMFQICSTKRAKNDLSNESELVGSAFGSVLLNGGLLNNSNANAAMIAEMIKLTSASVQSATSSSTLRMSQISINSGPTKRSVSVGTETLPVRSQGKRDRSGAAKSESNLESVENLAANRVIPQPNMRDGLVSLGGSPHLDDYDMHERLMDNVDLAATPTSVGSRHGDDESGQYIMHHNPNVRTRRCSSIGLNNASIAAFPLLMMKKGDNSSDGRSSPAPSATKEPETKKQRLNRAIDNVPNIKVQVSPKPVRAKAAVSRFQTSVTPTSISGIAGITPTNGGAEGITVDNLEGLNLLWYSCVDSNNDFLEQTGENGVGGGGHDAHEDPLSTSMLLPSPTHSGEWGIDHDAPLAKRPRASSI